jgi:tRNA U38,U39,U40 pseudouridine synthase TruA
MFVIVKFDNNVYKLIATYDHDEVYSYYGNGQFTKKELQQKFGHDSIIFNTYDIVDVFNSKTKSSVEKEYTYVFNRLFRYELFKISHSYEGCFEQKGSDPAKVEIIKYGNFQYPMIPYNEALRVINKACEKYYIDDSVRDIIKKNFLNDRLVVKCSNANFLRIEIFDFECYKPIIKYKLTGTSFFINSIRWLFYLGYDIEEKCSYSGNISDLREKAAEIIRLPEYRLDLEEIKD